MEFNTAFFADPASWEMIWIYISKGFTFSIALTLAATLGGIFFGTLIALMRLSSIKPLKWMATIYVDVVRSIPLLMVLLWFFYFFKNFLDFLGINANFFNANTAAIITFVAFEAAYFSEIVRAGINSVSREQSSAGMALGMTYGQNMKLIVLPQAFRNMIPVFLTQVVILFQDTSLVYIMGASDLFWAFDRIGRNSGVIVEMYILAAVAYFAICFTLSRIIRFYQKRIAIIR